MADDEADLTVRVTTESDTTAVDKATDSIGGLTEGAHNAAHEMREFTGSTREGQEAIRGIEAAFRGGAAGIGEMIRGLRALTLIVAHLVEESGPLGILLVLVGTIGGAMLAFASHTKEASGALDETSKKMEDLKKAVAEASKAVVEDFKEILSSIKEVEAEFEKLDKQENAAVSRDNKLTSAKRELAGAQLDADEQASLAAASTPEEAQHIKDVFAARRGLAKIGNEQEDSANSVLLAGARAQRAEDEGNQLSGIELAALAKQRQLENTAKDLTGKALRGQIPSKDAFAAQAAAKTGRAELDKTQGQLGTARATTESAQGAFQDAKDLDAVNQQRLRIAADNVKNVEGGRANEEAAKSAEHLATALERAAKAEESGEKKEATSEAKTAREEEKSDAASAKADSKARARTMSEVHREMHKETEAVIKLHEQSKRGSEAAHSALKGTRLIDRQLINETSYQASP